MAPRTDSQGNVTWNMGRKRGVLYMSGEGAAA